MAPRRRKPTAAEARRARLSFTRDESLVRHPCNSIEGKTFAAKVTEIPPHFDVLNNAYKGRFII